MEAVSAQAQGTDISNWVNKYERINQGLRGYEAKIMWKVLIIDDDEKLNQLLKDYLAKHHHIEISSGLDNIRHQFSKEDEIAIFRVLQEALTNIRKHSQATRVSIGMKEQEHEISFTIEDNGKGFDPKETLNRGPTERGLGLAAMDERVRMMGGCLDIWSREGEGAKILFTIPTN